MSDQTTLPSITPASLKGALELLRDQQATIERLRAGLKVVGDFLKKPEWGTVRYMEGSGVYDDKDAALSSIAYALGETDV